MRPAAIFLLMIISGASNAPTPIPGDAEFAHIDYSRARIVYDSLLANAPNSAEVLWRLARLHVCLGDIAPKEEKEQLYRQAESYARRSIVADSNNANAHTWLAASLGNIAMFEGSKAKVHLCNEIKRELDLAVALQPENDVAYSIMGSFYRALGNVSWLERQLASIFHGSLPQGGFSDAEVALLKARQLAPNVIRHHFELGLLYEETDRADSALAAFRAVIALPTQIASDKNTRAEAEMHIERLQDR